MSTATVQGPWALVTGASSGLGADFARELAARGFHLVLVARRTERLESLAEELQRAHGLAVRCEALDLTTPEAVTELAYRLRDLPIEILVNNAGIGPFGKLLDLPWERTREMLRLNMEAVVQLTRGFAPGMLSRGRGRVLLIGSTASFQPVPSMAAYAASKAFVSSFGNALSREWRGTGLTCTVLHPGFTATEFFETGGQTLGWLGRQSLMPSRTVARIGIAALFRGHTSSVAGLLNAIVAFLTRFLPRQASAAVAERLV